jgi:uncharacterized protein YbjT (DUF2867 family)
METVGKTALVIGATGLVGRALVQQLLEDAEYAAVHVFVRRSMALQHPKLTEHIIDFAAAATWAKWVRGDVLFSTLGTTRSQAGSTAAQRVVDYDYQFEFAKTAAANGVPTLVLVSSVGADAKSLFFYPKMKGELDRDVQLLGFPHVHILRPGPLVGPREVPRGGEKLGASLIGAFNAIGLFKQYRPIHDQEVARVMRIVAKQGGQSGRIYEPTDLFALLSRS